jgi:hypothetical protein
MGAKRTVNIGPCECCGAAENTCNDCDPPIPDTLYVQIPTGLTGCFADYSGNKYEVTWEYGCHWSAIDPGGVHGDIGLRQLPGGPWEVLLTRRPECYLVWEGSTGGCDVTGTYTFHTCYDYGFDCDYECGQDDPIGDVTVSEQS